MGSRLKINALIINIVVLVEGTICGAAGIILFISFIGITKLIADRSPNLRWLSVLLGDGQQKKGTI